MTAALGGRDYRTISSHAIITSGSMDNDTTCANISIMDDNALEGNQTFIVALSTSDPHVILENNRTTITIVDNDGYK